MAITLFSTAAEKTKAFFTPKQAATTPTADSILADNGLGRFYNNFSLKPQPQFIPQLSYFFNITIDFTPGNSKIAALMFNNTTGIQQNDFGLFVRSITIPGITSAQAPEIDVQTQLGKGLLTGKIAIPENFEFDIDILSTNAALHDTIFYPWILETASPQWIYSDRPYTIANITVSTLRNELQQSDKKEDNTWVTKPGTTYCFRGVVPTKIEMPNFTHVDQNILTRKVSFKFSNMFIVPPKILTYDTSKPV